MSLNSQATSRAIPSDDHQSLKGVTASKNEPLIETAQGLTQSQLPRFKT